LLKKTKVSSKQASVFEIFLHFLPLGCGSSAKLKEKDFFFIFLFFFEKIEKKFAFKSGKKLFSALLHR